MYVIVFLFSHTCGRISFLCSYLITVALFSDTKLEFGTVVIYTCVNNCWEDGCKPRHEHLIVQQDTDSEKCDTASFLLSSEKFRSHVF